MRWRFISIEAVVEAGDWRMKIPDISCKRKRSMTHRNGEIRNIGGEPEGGIVKEAKVVKNFRYRNNQQC